MEFSIETLLTNVILPSIAYTSLFIGSLYFLVKAIHTAPDLYKRVKGPKLKAALVIIAVGVLAWTTQPPDDLSLDSNCQPSGYVAAMSERLYGSQFWRSQYDAIQRVRLEEQAAPARMAEVRNGITRLIDDFRTRHPEIISLKTPEQREADELRARADQVEADESRKIVDRLRREWLSGVLRCEPVTREKAARI